MSTASVQLGLRENLAQFSLLVVVNAFVGAMIGMERSILPAIAEADFHLAARTAILSFIVVFGVTKALTNYVAGRLSDRHGRKTVLDILPEALGGHGEYVTKPSEFRPALARAYQVAARDGKPAVINCQGKKEFWDRAKYPPGMIGKVEPGAMSYYH